MPEPFSASARRPRRCCALAAPPGAGNATEAEKSLAPRVERHGVASGVELARRSKPFGMRIMAIDVRSIEQALLDEIQSAFLGSPDDLDRVVAESDYLSLHLHMTPETRHLIDKRRIELLNPAACLTDVARGELLDEAALYEALLQGRLGGAGPDVFAQEPPDPRRAVYALPNVVVTPHTAGVTDGTSLRRAEFAAANLDRYAQGLEPLGLVP